MKYLALVILLTGMFCACESPESKNYAFATFDDEQIPITRQDLNSPPTPLPPLLVEPNTNRTNQLIKEGSMDIKVSDLQLTKVLVDSLVGIFGGYCSRDEVREQEREKIYDLTIRVPAANFDNLIGGVEQGSGEVLNKSIETKDVTEDYYDLEMRLGNKRKYLNQYLTLLTQTKQVKDVLEVRESIRVLEEEIESTEGSLKYMKDRVAYSTLYLTIRTDKPLSFISRNKGSVGNRVLHSVLRGWYGFADFLFGLLSVWPLWLVVGLLVFVWRRFRNKRKAAKTE